ncbi:gamma-glutamyltransferase family protein [Shouchella shacheensis]|uniref:gamma-glutamyltransferase family protein n=1 Tax=Shouchella shacheensis TaxID=1649580 RepID=UPI00073FC30E|nr:gamma-glutamyltransferase family protein [Shouchella shacheensis]
MSVTFDAHHYPHTASRNVIYGRKGMVATSQPLAAQSGLEILKQGGNAIDAAIATAACLTVVEPTSNGIGSDAFALVWVDGKLHGLDASGQAPNLLTREAVKEAGFHDALPKHGMIPVTVPGAPGAWAALSKRFGKLPLTAVLTPAIAYAEEGFPVSPTLAKAWARAYSLYSQSWKEEEFSSWFETFTPNGRVPQTGELFRSPGHAKSLRAIAESNAESFYRGELAENIGQFFQAHGGFLRKADLAAFQPEWVDPIHINYRGYDVWEIPPSGQGLVALEALNILKSFDFHEKETIDTYHKQIEAIKLAFADGKKYITEHKEMSVSVEAMLSEAYAEERRSLIGEEAITPEPGNPPSGGTVYLASADGDGNMVSFIQSNFSGFGSGIVIPGTGISMQNRGSSFSMDETHANCLEPGKRTYHTIIPGFLTKGSEAVGPFGVMGGYMQPQGHVQVVMNTIDFGLNPQAALDAPRWCWNEGKSVSVEADFSNALAKGLARKGHDIQIALEEGGFGRGQIIWRDSATGVLAGGTESRTDGEVAAW